MPKTIQTRLVTSITVHSAKINPLAKFAMIALFRKMVYVHVIQKITIFLTQRFNVSHAPLPIVSHVKI